MAEDIRIKLVLDGKEFEASINRSKKAIGDLGNQQGGTSRLGSVFSGLGLGATAATVAIGATVLALKKIISFGMDAEEAASKFATIFAQNQGDVRDWADQAAAAMNRSSREMQDMAADVMALVSPMTATREAAVSMSQGTVEMAEDLASFHNVAGGAAEAIQAVRAGLIGSTEPLLRYGINVTEAALQEYALSQGINRRVSEMSTAEKLQLRYNAIMHQMGAAQGDAARTSQSLTNIVRGMQAYFRDTATEAGTKLVPAVTELAQSFQWAMQEGGFLKTALDGLVATVSALASGAATVIRLFSEQGRQMQETMDRAGNLQDAVRELEERWGSYEAAQTAATNNNQFAQRELEVIQRQMSRLGQETERYAPLLANLTSNTSSWSQMMRIAGFETQTLVIGLNNQSAAADAAADAARNAANNAAKAWRDARKRILEGMQSMWAELSGYVGALGDAETAQLNDQHQKQLQQLRESLRYRVISQSEYAAAVEALDSETEARRNEIAERGVMYRNLVEQSGLQQLTSAQRDAFMQMAQQAQDYNNRLDELHAAGRISAETAVYHRVSLEDMVNMHHAQLEQDMVATTEQALRAKFDLESRAFMASQMMASGAAALMGDKNKKLHKIGQIASVANVGMSYAEAVMKGYSYGPVIGTAYAALMGIVSARQIKSIWAQKPPEPIKPATQAPPSFATGVFDVPRDIYGANIHKGETIVTKSLTDSIKAGDVTLGSGSGGNTIIVQGSIIDKDGFMDSVGEALNNITQRTGNNFMRASVY